MKHTKERIGRYLALFALVLTACVISAGRPVQAKENTEDVPVMQESMTLYKGETRYLDIRNRGGKGKVTITVSDPGVIRLGKRGKITAKSCGNCGITVRMKMGEKVCEVKLDVEVLYSQYFHSDDFAKENVIKKTNKKMPYFVFHRRMKTGEKKALSYSNIMTAEDVTFSSSDSGVASVSRNGVITANHKGSAWITTCIFLDQKTYKYVEKIHVSDREKKLSVTEKERNAFYSQSAFVGSSIGVGQQNYFRKRGSGYLGNPAMLVKGCYSFYNDKSSDDRYKVTYNGTPYRAKDAIAKSGAKYVFINMGMNDLWMAPKKAYEEYVSYLEGIRSRNPNIVIFIESTTPVCKAQGNHLTNATVDEFNRLIKGYTDKQKDMYYIDVTSCLRDKSGKLAKEYTCDGHVHLTMSAYEKWMEQVCAFTDRLMLSQMSAEDAVRTAESSGDPAQYKNASAKVKKLKDSTVKTDLLKRLDKLSRRKKGKKT